MPLHAFLSLGTGHLLSGGAWRRVQMKITHILGIWYFQKDIFSGMPVGQDKMIYKLSGWSGGAIVLGKLPVPGVLLIWIRVEQGLLRLQWVRVGVFGHFSLFCHFSFLSPTLWETARYRLKYCLKGPLSPKQPTNQNISC